PLHQSTLIFCEFSRVTNSLKTYISLRTMTILGLWHALCQYLWHGYECRNIKPTEQFGGYKAFGVSVFSSKSTLRHEIA
ncbi:MAG: hypothetical protein ACK46A_06870, partial [Akkermansiaceae bacterium]